jgi:hypothetical protein
MTNINGTVLQFCFIYLEICFFGLFALFFVLAVTVNSFSLTFGDHTNRMHDYLTGVVLVKGVFPERQLS